MYALAVFTLIRCAEVAVVAVHRLVDTVPAQGITVVIGTWVMVITLLGRGLAYPPFTLVLGTLVVVIAVPVRLAGLAISTAYWGVDTAYPLDTLVLCAWIVVITAYRLVSALPGGRVTGIYCTDVSV